MCMAPELKYSTMNVLFIVCLCYGFTDCPKVTQVWIGKRVPKTYEVYIVGPEDSGNLRLNSSVVLGLPSYAAGLQNISRTKRLEPKTIIIHLTTPHCSVMPLMSSS
jgi:hypothetical protein